MGSLITVILDGLAYGMVLFIISVGLTITMGLMNIVNLAHGGFAMAGGYVASVLVYAGVPFLWATLIGMVVAGILGAIAELTVYRPVYRKGELSQLLMTFGLVFIVIATLTALFGTHLRPFRPPPALSGLVDIGFRTYPLYRLFLIGAGAALAVILWLVIDKTLYGARLRAAVDNSGMARAVGMDVNLLFTGTFAGGCALAGLGGILGADMMPLEPTYALRYLVIFLVVVEVGGHGNFKGSLVAALSLGLIETAGKFLIPHFSAYLMFSAVIALLLWRPHGLLPAKSAA